MKKSDDQPHEALARDARGAALLANLEAHVPAVPCASGSGLDRVPVPRSAGAPTGKRSGRYRAVSKLVRESRASIADLVR
jgi:hypothetical protein